jgi:4-amino-4-deoxy-L-arabinose transferase
MRSLSREKFLILFIFLIAYLLPLGARALTVPDETRYAEIPREMIATGDWMVPHLNGVRYFEKPVMGYWIHAISILIFGENNFAVRFPSALSAGLSAMLIFWLIGRSAGEKGTRNFSVAGLAALIFLTCFEVFGVGNTAVLDNLFALFLTAAVAAFYIATEKPPRTADEKVWLVLAGLAAGLAFLTKGFLAVAVPVLVLMPYLVWQQRSRDIFRMGWLPLLTTLLVALPWGVGIGLKEPDFWHFFFWNEHIRRFLGSNAQHHEPLWYFLMVAPAMFLPWTCLAPAAVRGLKQSTDIKQKQQRLIRLCICWIVLPFLFFSVSKGKLLTYILPCFPPFAILLASGLAQAVRTGKRKSIQWGIGGAIILFASVLMAFVLLQIFGGPGIRPFNQSWKALMTINALLYTILFGLWAFKCRLGINKLIVFGCSPLFLFFIAHFTIPDPVATSKAPGQFLERQRSLLENDSVVIADEESVRAICWYLKRSDVHVFGGTGELDYGLAYPDAMDRALSLDALKDMIRRFRGKLVVIARAENIEHWKNWLPRPAFTDTNGLDGYSLWKF